jgi:hypothetical protein
MSRAPGGTRAVAAWLRASSIGAAGMATARTWSSAGRRSSAQESAGPSASRSHRTAAGGGKRITGPLVHAPITIKGGDHRETEKIVRRELERFADLVISEINDGAEVDTNEVLA